jgi:acetyl/propionyl-CoA carboxylase alpha subunit
MCALREFPILGVQTNIEFLLRILDHPRFRAGDVDTGFLDAEGAALAASGPVDIPNAVQAAIAAHESESPLETQPSRPDPWQSLHEWRA